MEDSTKRRLIILAILVGVLIVLFVVSIVAGTGDDRGSGCSSGDQKSWRARLLPSKPVAPGQLSGCTTALGTVTIQGSCELKIAAADERSRRLVLEAIDAVGLQRVTDADGRRMEMNAKLKPGKPSELFVDKKGEKL